MTRTILLACFVGCVSAIAKQGVLLADDESQVVSVFTARQADAGRAAFEKHCASCHMPDLSGNSDAPALAGANFASTWRTRTTKDLFGYISAAMPPGGAPLSAEQYASIVARILQANGAVPGAESFSPSTAVSVGSVIPVRSAS
ncbi:MAG TPA: cytochrome c [Vicinamibacterales bacterium]|jgi:mono/diheme cytochrome c family protein